MMNRLKYLRKLLSHPAFKIIGGLITLLGVYDLFISQFILRAFQDDYPIISDYIIRLGWPWNVWIIIFLIFFLIVFFESSYKLLNQNTIHPVLKELSELRKEGINLWHDGERRMNQESVEKWWKKHVDWKSRCVNVVKKVDESLAGEIETLGTENGIRFKNGISEDHNHKVTMQSAWNNRLNKIIKEIRNKKYTG